MTTLTRTETKWWHTDADTGKVVCTLCPRECHIPQGSRGFCFVRANVDGKLELTTYGRSSGFCIDPIEKKPLNHFLPGTPVMSLGTAGCNLGCKFCQNWDISKSREMDTLAGVATPEAIVEAAQRTGCRSVAFTYNDPTIWAEYAIDIARVARQVGVKTVAVTAGYISPDARREFYHWMDAANVDLKAFTDTFYRKLTQTHLDPVLDTLKYLKHETDVWFEITNLMIPGENDSPDETRRMCRWIVDHLGDDVPVHFTAFHPDFKMKDKPRTPHETLIHARQIATEEGIKYAYVGNVYDLKNESTYCHNCGKVVIERDWYELGAYNLNGNQCRSCGTIIPGVFEDQPGHWGRKRQPVQIHATHQDLVRLGINVGGDEKLSDPDQDEYDDPPASPTGEAQNGAAQTGAAQMGAAHTSVSQAGTARTSAAQTATAVKAEQAETVAPRIDYTQTEADAILTYTRAVVQATVLSEDVGVKLPAELAAAPAWGLFVSLRRATWLRACRGGWGRMTTLGDLLGRITGDATAMDPRFASIDRFELDLLAIDVSLMYEPHVVEAAGEERISHVQVGTHGLVVAHPQGRGLLLPHVATENHWDAKTFLDQACVKAALPADAWRRDPATQLMTFRARLISAGPLRDELDVRSLGADRIHRLIDAANAMLHEQSIDEATQDDELLAEANAEELGVYLQTDSALTATAIGAGRSLIELAEVAVQSLKKISMQRRNTIEPVTRLSLLWQPIGLHAMDYPTRHQLLGRAAVLARSAGGWSLVMPNGQRNGDAVGQALASIGASAQQWSAAPTTRLTAFTTLNFDARMRPAGMTVRQPARAGQFYPADPADMLAQVDAHLAADGPDADKLERQSHRAVMLPHAGWRYCGDTIGKTLARTRVPDVVIIISPKHTPYGPALSVPPHQRWKLPGGDVPIATDVIKHLMELLADLCCEPDAHRLEHGVEVLLPFLRRLNPNVRVVPMVIGQCSYEATTLIAQALATVIEKAAAAGQAPLLVISSDMNHFAPEPENRRRDMLALEAMTSGDPAALYQTCQQQQISMCGLLPAVTVMQAIKAGQPRLAVDLVDYRNTAQVTGDPSRVVGYAGVSIR